MSQRKTSDERQHEIVAAAIKILGAHGLRELTAAHLAREVGIKDGTIFRHFKDMNAILLAVLAHLEATLLADDMLLTDDPVQSLRRFVVSRMRAVASQPGLSSLLFSDQLAHALGATGRRRVTALRNRGRDHVRACLRAALGQGSIRTDIDVELLTLYINGAVLGVLFAAKDGALGDSFDSTVDRVWHGLQVLLQKE